MDIGPLRMLPSNACIFHHAAYSAATLIKHFPLVLPSQTSLSASRTPSALRGYSLCTTGLNTPFERRRKTSSTYSRPAFLSAKSAPALYFEPVSPTGDRGEAEDPEGRRDTYDPKTYLIAFIAVMCGANGSTRPD